MQRGLPADRHFDEWAVANHCLEVLAAPIARDVRKDLPSLGLLVDDASRCWKVGADLAFEMERHGGVRVEIRDPAPALARRHAADVDPAVDVVKHDLDAPGPAGFAAGGGDIDSVPGLQGGLAGFLRC